MSAPDNARRLLGSEFPDDEGGDDPRLRSALTAYAAADDPQERRALLPACKAMTPPGYTTEFYHDSTAVPPSF